MKRRKMLSMALAFIMVFTMVVPYSLENVVYAAGQPKASIEGALETNATLTAKLTIDGQEVTEGLTYQWIFVDTIWDEISEEDEEFPRDIKGETSKTFVVPKNGKNKTYRVQIMYQGKASFADVKITKEGSSLTFDSVNDEIKSKLEKYKEIKAITTITLPFEDSTKKANISWTSDKNDYIANNGEMLKLPEEGELDVILTANISINGKSETREHILKLISKSKQELDVALPEGKLFKAKFGTDSNLKDMLKAYLDTKNIKAYIEIKEIKNTTNRSKDSKVDEDGTFHYFYADPFNLTGAPIFNNVYDRFEIKTVINKSEKNIKLDLYWDVDKLKSTLEERILGNITWDKIKKDNIEENLAVTDLSLPQIAIPEAKNCKLTWKSDKNAIKIVEPKGDTNTMMYGDFTGKVNRSKDDQTVKLTVTIKYVKSETTEAETMVANLKKEFTIKVPKLDNDAIKAEKAKMQKILDENYLEEKLGDSTKSKYEKGEKGNWIYKGSEKLDLENVTNDIQFLRPQEVLGKALKEDLITSDEYYNYGFKIISDSPVIEPNAYRGFVFRDTNKDTTVNLKVIMFDKKSPEIYVEKALKPITVKKLTKEELDAAEKLMKKSVEKYFDLIKGENTDINSISKDLHAFQEVILEGENAKGIYHYTQSHWLGVIPVSYKENLVQSVDDPNYTDEQYTYFNSNKPGIIQVGNPRLLTTPDYDVKVKVDSYLSHAVYGKYYTHYKKLGNMTEAAKYEKFYRQYAKADLVVKGIKGADPNPEAKINVKISISPKKGEYWVPEETVTLEKYSTAYEAFENIQKKYGIQFKGGPNYVSDITYKGETLGEKTQGKDSGWMYTVNGILSNKTLGEYVLTDGDKVEIFYTKKWQSVPGAIGMAINTPTIIILNTDGKVDNSKGTAKYDSDKKEVSITPNKNFKIKEIKVNGKTVEISNILKGIEPTDKVEIVFEEEAVKPETNTDVIKTFKLIAKSKQLKKGIKLTWKVKGDIALDGFQVYRSLNKTSGYKKFWETKNMKYINTKSLEKGIKYFYRIRGFKVVNDKKIYTKWTVKSIKYA